MVRRGRAVRGVLSAAAALSVIGASVVGIGAGVAGAKAAKPIVIGAQLDTAAATNVTTGFLARINAFNKTGGLGGRKIKFVGALNTNYSATTSLANAQKLTQSEHVTAVAPYFSISCTKASTGVLATAKTVFIGYSVCAGWQGNHWGIPINGSQVNPAVQSEAAQFQIIKLMEQTKSLGVSKASDVKIAIPGLSSAVGTFIVKTETAAAKGAGMTVVFAQADMPFTATNYAPFAQQIIAAGANAVYPPVSEPQAIGLLGALKAAGFKGAFFDGSTYTPGEVTSSAASALTGGYVINEFPVNEDNTATVKLAEKRLKQSGYSTKLGNGVSVGYWSADLLIDLLQATAKRVGVAKVNSVTMEATVAKGWTYKGGAGTETFPKAWTDPIGCYTMVKHVGTGYKLVLPFGCNATLATTGL